MPDMNHAVALTETTAPAIVTDALSTMERSLKSGNRSLRLSFALAKRIRPRLDGETSNDYNDRIREEFPLLERVVRRMAESANVNQNFVRRTCGVRKDGRTFTTLTYEEPKQEKSELERLMAKKRKLERQIEMALSETKTETTIA